jgi:anti-sigma factor RsiW
MRPDDMLACDRVRLLLGPFEDGELEPHEMEDIAFHVVTCPPCKSALEDYRSLGVALRDSFRLPAAEDFTQAVLQKIEQRRHPLWRRFSGYLDGLAERVGAAIAITALATVAAVAALVTLSPYPKRLLHHSNPVAQVSPTITLADRGDVRASPGPTPEALYSGSPATDEPVITLSDDPTTTVIWLQNQP